MKNQNASPILIVPHPKKTRHSEGRLPPPPKDKIRFAGEASETLANALDRLPLPEKGGNGAGLKVAPFKAGMEPQAYRLLITPKGAEIEGGGEPGVFYAFQTLHQILMQCGDLPCMEIEDAPDIPERGFMLDISRNKVPSLESLFDLADLLAFFKINQLQLYTEHTFAFAGHELVWGDASPMTGEEIRLLDAYCKARCIELVPNLNSFGHVERWLRYPEYFHLAECPYGWNAGEYMMRQTGSVLRPSKESLEFLDSLYADMLPCFSSKKFNVGCDETWELGLGWSRFQAEKEGKTKVYLKFLQKIQKLARKHGKEMQFWADIVLKEPSSVASLSKDVTPIIWGYSADHPYAEQCPVVKDAGLEFYVAPGTSACGAFTGNLDNAMKNLVNASGNGHRHGARGLLITNWGDSGHHQVLPLSYPGLLYGAAVAWGLDNNENLDPVPALSRLVFQDPTERLAGALADMGRLNSLSPKPQNYASELFRIFFSSAMNMTWSIRGHDRQTLRKLLEYLDAAEEKFSGAKPLCADASYLLDEMKLAADMARWAARRGLAWFDLMEKGEHKMRPLRCELKRLTGEFEKIWLRRNRPGGLHESSAKMREILDELNLPAASPLETQYRTPLPDSF